MEWVSDEQIDLNAVQVNKEPFAVAPDPAFYFRDALLAQRLGMLQHFSRYSDLLLMVIGAQGIGKTSLLQQFVASIDDRHISRVDSKPMMSANALLEAITEGFGLPPQSGKSVESFVQDLRHAVGEFDTGLLLVDDAHLMSSEALQLLIKLSQLQTQPGSESSALLRIILFCEPSIEQMLADPAIAHLRDQITHRLDVPPLSEDQVSAYLRHRLEVAGHHGPTPFSHKEVKRIARGSQGNPGMINRLAREQMANYDIEVIPYVGERTRHRLGKLLAVTAAIALLLGAYLYRDKLQNLMATNEPSMTTQQLSEHGQAKRLVINVEEKDGEGATATPSAVTPRLKGWPDDGSKTTEALTPAEAKVEPNHDTPQTPVAAKSEPESSPVVASQTAKTAVASTKDATDIADASGTGGTVEASTESTSETELPRPQIDRIEPNPVTASKRRQAITLHGKGFGDQSKVSVGWTGKTRTLGSWQVRVVNEGKIVIRLTTGMGTDTWTVRVSNGGDRRSNVASFLVVSPAEAAKNQHQDAKQAASVAFAGLRGAGWVAKQSPRHYTLQLLAIRRPEGIRDYVARYGIKDEVAAFTSRRNGVDWHYLVYGSFASEAEAKTAASELSLRTKSNPWVRSFAALQDSLPKVLDLSAQRTAVPQATPKADTEDATQDKRRSEDGWLWSQSPSHHTLQLVAASRRSNLESFAEQHKLGTRAVIYQTLRKGQPWYVLLYGVFPSQEAARDGIDDLPEDVQALKPWSRSFASVHKDLEKRP